MDEYLLAIDIGGSKYMVAIADTKGNIIESCYYKWKALNAERVVDETIKSARELLERHSNISISSIGITIPGLADPIQGIWVESSFSGIGNLNMRAIFEEEFGIPVYIDNDAQACALAEKLFGGCKETKNFIYMTISNGIGGAIFINDMLYYGGFGNAGEIGHCVVVEDGYQCKCGNKGCLEMHAAGPGIVRNFVRLGGSNSYKGLPIDAKIIAKLAYEGNKTALKTFELEGYYLGKLIALVSNVLNPERVIIGGGVSMSFSLFEEALWRTIDKFLFKSANPSLEILPSQFGYNGGILGAVAAAICQKNNLY